MSNKYQPTTGSVVLACRLKPLDRNHCPLFVNTSIWICQGLHEISEDNPSNWHSALLFFISMSDDNNSLSRRVFVSS